MAVDEYESLNKKKQDAAYCDCRWITYVEVFRMVNNFDTCNFPELGMTTNLSLQPSSTVGPALHR